MSEYSHTFADALNGMAKGEVWESDSGVQYIVLNGKELQYQHSDGRRGPSEAKAATLLRKKWAPAPVTGECWVNVYSTGEVTSYNNELLAKAAAASNSARVAVRCRFEEIIDE